MSFYAVYSGSGSGGGASYDTGAGATTSNTLRTVIVTDQTPIPVVSSPGTLDFGASAAAERVAALLGNSTGAASFGVGAANAQTLRASISTDSILNGISNPVSVLQSGTWTNTVTQATAANLNATVVGSVSVSNFPATQPISGSVSVSNFPATQPVSGTVTANAGTGDFTVVQPTAANLNATIVGTVAVSNFPTTQPVSGTVAATQSGTWNVNNTPTGAAVSNSEGEIAGTSLTTAYATVLTPAFNTKILFVANSTDQPVRVSIDGGTTSTFYLTSNQAASVDFATNNLFISSGVNIQAKYAGTAPTMGQITVTAMG